MCTIRLGQFGPPGFVFSSLARLVLSITRFSSTCNPSLSVLTWCIAAGHENQFPTYKSTTFRAFWRIRSTGLHLSHHHIYERGLAVLKLQRKGKHPPPRQTCFKTSGTSALSISPLQTRGKDILVSLPSAHCGNLEHRRKTQHCTHALGMMRSNSNSMRCLLRQRSGTDPLDPAHRLELNPPEKHDRIPLLTISVGGIIGYSMDGPLVLLLYHSQSSCR